MSVSNSTAVDTAKALAIWAAYQRQHDISDRKGHAVGIDPVSGRVWFGDSIVDICRQLDSEAIAAPLYFLRIGHDYYYRKGGRQ